MLRDTLVCKGDTALKECYFEDYRLSEGLDLYSLEGKGATRRFLV